jgi:hypothetical protein
MLGRTRSLKHIMPRSAYDEAMALQRLQWVEGGDGAATLKRARSRWLVYVFGGCFNLAFALAGVVNFDRPRWPNVILLGVVGVVVCAVLAARAALVTTTLRFAQGQLQVASTWGGGEAVSVALSEVVGFEVVQDPVTLGFHVVARFKTGATKVLPVDIEPFAFGFRGSQRPWWVAPRSDAEFIAARLNAGLR